MNEKVTCLCRSRDYFFLRMHLRNNQSIYVAVMWPLVHPRRRQQISRGVRHQGRQWQQDMESRPLLIAARRAEIRHEEKEGGAASGALPIPARRGQIRREERRRRQLRSLNVTRDSPRRGPLSGADRRDPGWSLSGTDLKHAVRNCVADTRRFVRDSLSWNRKVIDKSILAQRRHGSHTFFKS